MSTLKVNTVQHNTSGFNNVVQFTDGAGTQNGTLCRVWVNWNGTGTVAIRASFNVNTITDNGTGDYTVNFSNALTDANYACVGMAHANGGGIMDMRGNTLGPDLKSSTQCRVRTQGNDGAVYDIANPTFAAFR